MGLNERVNYHYKHLGPINYPNRLHLKPLLIKNPSTFA